MEYDDGVLFIADYEVADGGSTYKEGCQREDRGGGEQEDYGACTEDADSHGDEGS